MSRTPTTYHVCPRCEASFTSRQLQGGQLPPHAFNGVPCVAAAPSRKRKRIAEVDFDHAHYIGSDEDGVYYDVAKGKDGWYLSLVVDCNSAGFCEPMTTDDGPYPTEAEALEAGKGGAIGWCIDNDVQFEEPAAGESEGRS